jgi:hypothetical protein
MKTLMKNNYNNNKNNNNKNLRDLLVKKRQIYKYR